MAPTLAQGNHFAAILRAAQPATANKTTLVPKKDAGAATRHHRRRKRVGWTHHSRGNPMKKPSLTAAKRKIAAAKNAKPKTQAEWSKVIKIAESVLKSAGIKS